MRCRECAAEVAVTARACSRCGAPIVGQPPVVADAVVADTVAGSVSDAVVSDAASKAVAAAAGKALPEPFVPASGAKVPAKFRLVLAGYIGIACGLFACALACAAVAVYVLFSDAVYDLDDGTSLGAALQFIAVLFVLSVGGLFCIWGLGRALRTLKVRSRFSGVLRRPSDPRTATVMASKRGGRTLILDIIPRDGTSGGYQGLSEVRLALWLKAGMLTPGETVKVYGGPGGRSPLLLSSTQRNRVFLGTVTRSTVRPGPLDEKVTGTTLVDCAAWAASTTFSSTGRRFGYDTAEVDAFRSAVRDAFLGGAVLGVTTPPVRSDEVRGKQFSIHRRGYDKTEVDAFLEAAGLRLAAMESTDRPTGPLVNGAVLIGWADWADSTTFSTLKGGYRLMEVDAFLRDIRDTFLGVSQTPVRADDVRGKQFPSTDDTREVAGGFFVDPIFPSAGYDKKQVAAFLEAVGIRLAAMESTDRPQGPLVSEAPVSQPQWESPEDPHSLPSSPSPISGSEGKSEGEAEADGAGDPASSHPGLVRPFMAFLGGLVVTVATLLAISLPATRAERAIEQGPRLTATVSDVRQPGVYEDLLLTYSYDGQEYSIWRGRNDTSPPLGVGMTVQVSLDPADPGWAASETLDPTSAFVETFIIVGTIVGPVITVWAGVLWIRRLSERFRARRTDLGHS